MSVMLFEGNPVVGAEELSSFTPRPDSPLFALPEEQVGQEAAP
jgi:hypothetical protein